MWKARHEAHAAIMRQRRLRVSARAESDPKRMSLQELAVLLGVSDRALYWRLERNGSIGLPVRCECGGCRTCQHRAYMRAYRTELHRMYWDDDEATESPVFALSSTLDPRHEFGLEMAGRHRISP